MRLATHHLNNSNRDMINLLIEDELTPARIRRACRKRIRTTLMANAISPLTNAIRLGCVWPSSKGIAKSRYHRQNFEIARFGDQANNPGAA